MLRGALCAWREEAAAGARVLQALEVAARAKRRGALGVAWRLWLGAMEASEAAAAALVRSLAARVSRSPCSLHKLGKHDALHRVSFSSLGSLSLQLPFTLLLHSS